MNLKVEHIKTGLIIMLAMLSLQLGIAYKNTHRILTDITDFGQNFSETSRTHDFRSKLQYIQGIENNEIDDVKYSLYYSALYDAEHLSEHSVENISLSEIEEFRHRYSIFMEKQCDEENYRACVAFGDILLDSNQFDRAHSVYLKAAENESYDAMSRLVYLHLNKNWSNRSEELSNKWLTKLSE